jgi:hypothetical protein
MYFHSRMLAAAISVFLWLFSGSLVAQELLWQLKTGDQLDVVLSQQKIAHTSVDEKVAKTDSQTKIRQRWNVESIDENGNYRVKQVVDAIRLSVANPEYPQQALFVDTESELKVVRESANVLKQIRPLIGMELFVTMTPRGEILAVTYSDEAKKILQELPGSLNLQALFSVDGMKDLLGAAAIVFPEKTPDQGETWEISDSVLNSLGKFLRVRKYQLADLEDLGQRQIAVVKLNTTIQPESVDGKNGKLNSFTETGELRIDIGKGYVQSSQTHSVTEAETNYRDIAVKTTIESTCSVTINVR